MKKWAWLGNFKTDINKKAVLSQGESRNFTAIARLSY